MPKMQRLFNIGHETFCPMTNKYSSIYIALNQYQHAQKLCEDLYTSFANLHYARGAVLSLEQTQGRHNANLDGKE